MLIARLEAFAYPNRLLQAYLVGAATPAVFTTEGEGEPTGLRALCQEAAALPPHLQPCSVVGRTRRNVYRARVMR